MNKIFKYILGIIPLIIGVSFCNAGLVNYGGNSTETIGTTRTQINLNSGACLYNMSSTTCNYSFDGTNTEGAMERYYIYCFTGNVYFKTNQYSIQLRYVNLNLGQTTTCEEQYTSLECQTEYNLIPIENITANYCHVNFGLIDPASCPINEGTGAINWSSLYINETQYSANDTIRLGIPEFIAWNLTYNTGETLIEIEGYNADTEYMDSIIAQTEIGATAEDMTTLVQGLQVYLPYFFIGMIILFFIGLVRKFFRG